MKNILLALAVFLVCDAQIGVTHYALEINGAPVITVEAVDNALRYDLTGLPDGLHDFTIRAKNIWGLSDPIPFGFSKGVPAAPSGIGLSE